ncbi:glycosyltransferase [Vibrio splendidus]
MKDLILITNAFPYGKREEFLENEIEYLSDNFDKIIIIPIETTGKSRDIPRNCHVLIGKNNAKLDFIKSVGWKSIIFEAIFRAQLSPKKINHILSYIRKSSYIYNIIDSIPDKSNYVGYSYWLNACAFSMIGIKEIDYKVSRSHRYDLYDYASETKYQPFQGLLLSYLDKVFPCSNDGSEYLKNRHPKNSSKIKTSYLGTKSFEIEYDLGYKKDSTINIVSCSSMISVKRVPLIASALKLLSKKGVKFNWVHFGDGSEMNEVIDIIHGMDNCTMMGHVENSQVLEFYRKEKVDLFINVSESEGIPVSIMEAMSFGTPVLATNVGGVSEIISEQEGSLLNPCITDVELCDAIYKTISQKNTLNEKRRSAKSRWESSFSARNNYTIFARNLKDSNNE